MGEQLDYFIDVFFHRGESPGLKNGQPALFVRKASAAHLFEEPTEFLTEKFVKSGSTPSPNTWSKNAYSLKVWFDYCRTVPIDWRNATEENRASFRDGALGSISPRTCQPYGSDGIRDIMRTVARFYDFERNKGRYSGDVGLTTIFEADPTSQSYSDKNDKALPKPSRNQAVYPLTLRDLQHLLRHIGPQATDRDEGDLRTSRDRTIVDIAYSVGLRVKEIVNLKTINFLSMTPDKEAPYAMQELTVRGKGNKVRQVAVPNWLVFDVLEYISVERENTLKLFRGKADRKTTALFLVHAHARNHGHLAIGCKAIQKMFERACLASGLTEQIEKTDLESDRNFVDIRPKYSFHDLRHTYAVLNYHAEVRNGNPEPWKKIQAQLGHASLETTRNIYLAHVEIFDYRPAFFNIKRSMGLR